MISLFFTTGEVAHAIKLSNTKLVITDTEDVNTVAEAVKILGPENPVQVF